MTLLDAAGRALIGRRMPPNAPNQRDAQVTTVPISVGGQTVGTLQIPGRNTDPARRDAENGFLQRVSWAAAAAAGIAALLALLLGTLLARTLTRPIRELTAATHALASGALGQQVTVHSRDEIGELAGAFNSMTADLARSTQQRKQMTADLAHDLRTPLSILRGYTEGLKDERLRATPALYGIMHGEVEHLQHLVDDLRILSLADAGELPLNRRPVDPRALVERSGLAYIVQAEQQQVALTVDAAEDLPDVVVDTDRIAQVLNNLVSNALRHTPAGGAITLAAHTAQQRVLISVSDSGSGITAEDLPFIFDRLYRADKARQRSDGTSSGLGLAIAKAIIEAHGGTIAATSTPEQGTIFTIALPAASAA